MVCKGSDWVQLEWLSIKRLTMPSWWIAAKLQQRPSRFLRRCCNFFKAVMMCLEKGEARAHIPRSKRSECSCSMLSWKLTVQFTEWPSSQTVMNSKRGLWACLIRHAQSMFLRCFLIQGWVWMDTFSHRRLHAHPHATLFKHLVRQTPDFRVLQRHQPSKTSHPFARPNPGRTARAHIPRLKRSECSCSVPLWKLT